jgi:quinol-cytochrome oxidoreductase complex cytochrome b subunit
MADDEMAVHESSEEDYVVNPEDKKEDKNKPKRATSKKQGYTLFDFMLMLIFVTLIGGMLFLKYRAEMNAKESDKIAMKIKVPVHVAYNSRKITFTENLKSILELLLQKLQGNTES